MLSDTRIRKATMDDFDCILSLYRRAREFMRVTGNPGQWGSDRPSPAVLAKDIELGNLYVVWEKEQILGVFALIFGGDPTYSHIDGSWLNDEPYVTIHRIASAGLRSGILKECLDFCGGFGCDVRIDTHEDNHIMQHLLNKYGFTKCGIIYLQNGDPRIAYQRTI